MALAAVALTTWLTLGAVFEAQRELFGGTGLYSFWDEAGRSNFEGSAAARDAFRGVTRTAFLAGFLAFLLASVVAGFVTRFLTRPLSALTDGAQRLAAGERGLRLPLPKGKDELRSLTEAFNGLVAGLERQERWRREMVADIAHDLRTPLAVMRSELEAMQDGVRPLGQAGLERLHSEVMLLSRLVDDLRTLSLAEGGGLPLRLEPIPVAPFITGIAASFASRAQEVGAELRLELSDLFNATVAADRHHLTRVLGNLLDNALRYAAPGPVELGGKLAGGWIVLEVRDHGPGLPEGMLERAFERFARGDAARTRQDGGTGSGLGLAIARALTEAHGGTLKAANHKEGGAVFTLALGSVERVT